MKLPLLFSKFLPHESQHTLMFLSLIITTDNIEGSVWHTGEHGETKIDATAREKVSVDSWEERIVASDKVIGKLEKAVPGALLTKVVLGLPSDYLTQTGEIESDIRQEIKKLTKELQLSPIGFVAVSQALVHKIKIDEGVPPSVILLNVKSDGLTVYLYKVGNLLGEKSVSRQEVVADLEAVLKSFKDLEVLPSRILLYGENSQEMEEVKRLLLKHPWPTRANFLHFPKIEILPSETTIEAVTLAGSSEIKAADDFEAEEKIIAQPDLRPDAANVPEKEEIYLEKNTDFRESPDDEESNIQMVEPESLGFKKSADILEEDRKKEETEKEEIEEEKTGEEKLGKGKKMAIPFKLPAFDFSGLAVGAKLFAGRGIVMPLVGVAAVIFFMAFAVYWFVPRASVTILELTKPVDETADITIDLAATVADANSKIIPGTKLEQSVTGEKAVPTSGKKQVGNPAKGIVTIYNKDPSASKNLPKGSILTSGALKFTLDSDVTVASASQQSTFDPVVFAKTTGNITAGQIGMASNLPAGTQFDFQDFSNSMVVARNDQPLAGGTSKDITVVSRDDYDSLVKSLTAELVKKAQGDLGSSVSGRQKLIEDTIKASVSAKNFTEEIDEEANQVHGKLTVTVTGLSYNEDDIATLMKNLAANKLPKGFNFVSSEMQIKLSKVQVKKDGSVTANVQFHANATPTFDLSDIRKKIAGKSVRSAQEYLKTITGVGGVEFGFSWNIFGNRLPNNSKNISVTVAMQ